jgi:hypothetical protein
MMENSSHLGGRFFQQPTTRNLQRHSFAAEETPCSSFEERNPKVMCCMSPFRDVRKAAADILRQLIHVLRFGSLGKMGSSVIFLP